MSEAIGDYPLWRAGGEEVEVLFVGRGPRAEPREVLQAVASRRDREAREVAWLHQRHSARCVAARAGRSGEGDALWTRDRELALCVVAADCVPVVVAGGGALTVIHAGWRGIVSGIVGSALREAGIEGASARAWIGPAIGPCCYEVGAEVAALLQAASLESAALPGAGDRPHADLGAAVSWQLGQAGVESIARQGQCTRCAPDLLWSYRREGPGAGRNLTFAWLTERLASNPVGYTTAAP